MSSGPIGKLTVDDSKIVILRWTPTPKLRWSRDNILEQLWTSSLGGEEWRAIPKQEEITTNG